MRVNGYMPDPYFRAGITALLQTLQAEHDLPEMIHVLHFPDMRHLLTWSREASLPDCPVLIACSSRPLAALRGVFSPRHVLLLDDRHSLPACGALLVMWLSARNRPAMPEWQRPVRLNPREMRLVYRQLNGLPERRGSKADCQIRHGLMRKTGAENRVFFLVRLRLLFYPDRRYLLQVPAYVPARQGGQITGLSIHR